MYTMSTVGVELISFIAVLIFFAVMVVILVITLVIAAARALFMRRHDKNKACYARLRRRALWSGAIAVMLTLMVLASQWLAYTPPILNADGSAAPGSIASLEAVELNGSKQWITVRGVDTTKPVLLFLAGGPGGSQLAAARSELGALEKDFVVVGWDQPGSAKSYSAVAPSVLTRQRYIDDGCMLAQYLCERFGQEKIYLVGESWGSALGIWMVQQRPELFHAFVGTGQMVSFLDTENDCYYLALKTAQDRGDTQVERNLKLQGPPPYYGKGVAMKMATYLMYLFNVMSSNPEIARSSHNTFTDLAGPEYGLFDKLTYILGMTDTLGVVYQQLYDLDLRKQAAELNVPVYFFEGRHDINAPTYLVEDYCNVLDAPYKRIIWFEHSGHTPWVDENELFVQTLVDVLLTDTQ
jgi:pimeloyl-ACP methyl ester carboxylesterase